VFNIQKFYVLLIQCAFVVCVGLEQTVIIHRHNIT